MSKHVAQPVREPLEAIAALASYTIDSFFTVIEGNAPSLYFGTVPCSVFPSSVTCLCKKSESLHFLLYTNAYSLTKVCRTIPKLYRKIIETAYVGNEKWR